MSCEGLSVWDFLSYRNLLIECAVKLGREGRKGEAKKLIKIQDVLEDVFNGCITQDMMQYEHPEESSKDVASLEATTSSEDSKQSEKAACI